MVKTPKIGQKTGKNHQKMTKIVKNIANETGSAKNQPKIIKWLIFELDSENVYLIDDSWSYQRLFIKIKVRKSCRV